MIHDRVIAFAMEMMATHPERKQELSNLINKLQGRQSFPLSVVMALEKKVKARAERMREAGASELLIELINYNPLIMQGLQVGHLVKLKKNYDGSKSGTCAYVYSTSADNEFPDNNAAFLITRYGIDLSRMNVRRQNEFLEFIADSEFRYEYDGDLKLKRDWTDGKFEEAFIKCNS